MKKYLFLIVVLFVVSLSIQAQTEVMTQTNDVEVVDNDGVILMNEVPVFNKPSSGDYYEGFTRKVSWDRMILPYGLEVTYEKTVHVIFPSPIAYVDLGSANIIAGKAGPADNVLRIKSAIRGFESETNFSVITEEGSFYTFVVKYANEPDKLNVEMKDFMHDGEVINKPNNALDIYLKELGNESPKLVYLINRSIHKDNKRHVKHIGSKKFGIQYIMKGIYTHNGLLYFHTQIENKSNVPFDIDFIRMKVVDKKVTKRTAIQETVIYPTRAYNYVNQVNGKSTERTVFTLDKITIPDDKQLIIELFEKNGGRHQSFFLENSDLNNARSINELKVK